MADDVDESKIVQFRPAAEGAAKVYEHTMVSNTRRYRADACRHKGPYIVDAKLAAVECGDCGAFLNPLYVLEKLAHSEAYWNQRQKDLSAHLAKIEEEIKDRTRTRCTHCGNMTAIRLKHETMPHTWRAEPYT